MILTTEHLQVLQKHQAYAPVRLAVIAEELGVEVFRSSLRPDISGLIEPSESARAKFRIKINRFEVPERQRFTLAHELAHFLLHRDQIGAGVVDNVMYRSNLSSRREVEANKLAADIIMPRTLIRKEIAKFDSVVSDETVAALAETFKVSQPAMRIRLGG